MQLSATLPLFHLYGDPPDDQAFDFIHIETISSRSSVHDWTIRAHRHRNLFQILLIVRGGGEMTFEAQVIAFDAPAAIIIPATIAHGFRFRAAMTEGWVLTFTEDVARALGERSGEALSRLRALAADPVVPLIGEAEVERIGGLCADLHEERFLARDGYRFAMRGYLALIAIGVARLAASRARTGAATLIPADPTVDALRYLVEEHFRKERQLSFYADKLAMTPDRLNDHVKRAAGVTAGHMIRQRVLTEAEAPACLHQPADPRDRLRSHLRRPLALRSFLPQTDRHHAPGVPRSGRRVIASRALPQPPVMSCGVKVRSSTLHSSYLSTGSML